jgi:putative RNA 2'-phosphotransferase
MAAMNETNMVRISKFLSKHLRHDPAGLGLELETGGWVKVDDLLAACARKGQRLSRETLEAVVAGNDKQRFSFDDTGTRIRANQGHSVEIDLQLKPQPPPALLFHGTGHTTADVIAREGLERMQRHHVHLSPDLETARKVGARHGKPVLFEVDTARMHADGFEFYRSENGVWLVDNVPAGYLRRLSQP